MGVTGCNILSLECVSAKIVILIRSNKEGLCFLLREYPTFIKNIPRTHQSVLNTQHILIVEGT